MMLQGTQHFRTGDKAEVLGAEIEIRKDLIYTMMKKTLHLVF
jgi:hypothetical protein